MEDKIRKLIEAWEKEADEEYEKAVYYKRVGMEFSETESLAIVNTYHEVVRELNKVLIGDDSDI